MVWKPHATVAAIVERDNKFLMVEELTHGKKVFNQPAGHLDPDESLIDAVKRETLEETAWNFVPQAITGIYLWKHPDNGESFLRVAFCGICHDYNPEQSLDDGILQAVWKSRDELIEQEQRLRSPMVLKCIDDYLASKRFPLDMLVDVPS
ncbi:MAG: NUDIX hydrolase [Gammaproteobacteria bacterium]|nr:MAG: NUDIX hydrolase [Gammaproteobacteria bacterium]